TTTPRTAIIFIWIAARTGPVVERRACGDINRFDRRGCSRTGQLLQLPPLGQQLAHLAPGKAIIDQINDAAILTRSDHAACGLNDLLQARVEISVGVAVIEQ